MPYGEHELKTLPNYWDAVARGEKTFRFVAMIAGFRKATSLPS